MYRNMLQGWLVVLLLAPAAWADLNEGLQAYWNMDEGQGDTVYDSADSYHGTRIGATWTSGRFNGALNFDGVDDYVSTTYDVAPTEYTVSLWYNLNEDIDTSTFLGWRSLLHRTSSSGSDKTDTWSVDFYGVEIDEEIYSGLIFRNETPQDNYVNVTYKPAIFHKNEWHMVTVTGTSTLGKLYFDGNPIDQVSGNFIAESWTDTTPINIGMTYSNILGEPWKFFNGKIDEVRIYNRVLSDDEIRALFPEPGTLSLFALGGLVLRKRRRK